MYYKFFLMTIISCMAINSCVVNRSNEETTNYSKIDFNEFENKYFNNFERKVKNSTFKPEVYSRSFELKKKDLSILDFQAIQEKLKKEGWEMVEDNNGYYYCYGDNYSFDALYPSFNKHFNKNGIPIIIIIMIVGHL